MQGSGLLSDRLFLAMFAGAAVVKFPVVLKDRSEDLNKLLLKYLVVSHFERRHFGFPLAVLIIQRYTRRRHNVASLRWLHRHAKWACRPVVIK